MSELVRVGSKERGRDAARRLGYGTGWCFLIAGICADACGVCVCVVPDDEWCATNLEPDEDRSCRMGGGGLLVWLSLRLEGCHVILLGRSNRGTLGTFEASQQIRARARRRHWALGRRRVRGTEGV